LNKRRSVVAVYPASFDPITLGHVDVATRAAAIFDQLILAVYDRPMKTLLFPTAQRVELVRQAVAHLPNVQVDTYAELTVEFAREIGASVIVRGLRTMSDFEREYGMAQLNRGLNSEVDVVCLMASQRFSYVSSSSVKEIAALGGPVDELVPEHVAQALRSVYGARSGR
jgi:pantetheine-phosphate adenylyltransferase